MCDAREAAQLRLCSRTYVKGILACNARVSSEERLHAFASNAVFAARLAALLVQLRAPQAGKAFQRAAARCFPRGTRCSAVHHCSAVLNSVLHVEALKTETSWFDPLQEVK